MNNQFNGIRIYGACSPMDLEGNIFNDHGFGLSLTYNGLMGSQYNSGNRWEGTYTSYGAYLSGINSSSAVANQIQYYDPAQTNTPPTTHNDILNFGWFLDSRNPDEFLCDNFVCQPYVPVNGDHRSEDEIVAQEDDIGTEYVDPSNYFADRNLLQRLLSDPDLMQDNPILQAFYNQKIFGTVGMFSELTQEMENAVRHEAVYSMVYSTNENIMQCAADSLDILDSLFQNGYTGPTNERDLNQTIADARASNEIVMQSIQQIRQYRIDNSIDNNNDIPVSEQYESNESTVNNIYLATVASGIFTLTSSQQSALIDIAYQCPFSGGPAVYKARSLYHMYDPDLDWDDETVCTYQGILPRLSKPESKRFALFPNPTTGMVTLNYFLEKDSRGIVEIYNTLGILISSTILNPENQVAQIDLSAFKPALYHYKIIENNTLYRQGVISIIR